MMNKRSSRLIAWLLTLVMVLNMSPVSAFAGIKSNELQGPDYPVLATLSTGSVPTGDYDDFTVQYVIKGDYTYDGNNLILYKVEHVTGKPSEAPMDSVDKCSGPDRNTATWDEATKTLSFYPVPNTASLELRYDLVIPKGDGTYEYRTFQILQNGEGGLRKDDTVQEALEVKDCLAAINGTGGDNIVLRKINGVDIKQVLPFTLPDDYTHPINKYTVSSVNTLNNNTHYKDYTISYIGHNNGSGSETIDFNSIVKTQFKWTGQGQVVLYYLLEAEGDDNDVTKYTITWLDEDGSELATTQVKEGYTPVYPKGTPTKASDDTYKYTFSGWTPNVVPATEDKTYTAQYASSDKNAGVVNVQYTLNNNVKPTGYTVPVDENHYSAGDTVTKAAKPNYPGYTFTGWGFNGDNGDTFVIPDSFNENNPTVTLQGQFAEQQVTINYSASAGGSVSRGGDYSIGAATATVSNVTATANSGYEFECWKIKIGGQEYDLTSNTTASTTTLTPQKGDDNNSTAWTNREYVAHFTEIEDTTGGSEATLTIELIADSNGAAAAKNSQVDIDNIYVADANGNASSYVTYYGGAIKVGAATKTFTIAKNTKYVITFRNNEYVIGAIEGENATLGTGTVDLPVQKNNNGTYNSSPIAFTSGNAANVRIKLYEVGSEPGGHKYTVTFVDEDNTVLKPATEYNEGTAAANIVKPADPQKTGYTFSGWDTIPATLTANTVVKATYSINQYSVTFVDEDNETVLKEATLYDYGTAAASIVKPEDPQKTGYTFSGWATIPATLTANTVVKATYIANTNTAYTVKYMLQNIEDDEYTENEEARVNGTGTTDTEAEAEVKTFAGFTYDAANTNNQLKGNIAGDGSLVLKLYYTRNSYDVEYTYTNAPEGATTLPATISYKYGATVTVAEKAANITGYSVGNWNRTGTFTMPAEKVTISANWTINSSKLTYLVDEVETEDSSNVAYNTAVVLPDEPTKDGYTFSGWLRDGVEAENFNMPDEAVTISGTFTANTDTEYTIETYLQNLDDTYPTTASSSTTEQGTTDTEASVTASTITGFTFDANNTNNVLSGNIAGDGSLVLKLYYTRNSYDVEYTYTNAPEGATTLPATISYKYGASVTVEGKAANITGYTVGNWNKTGTFTMPAEKVTISANWTINSYRLTYKVDGTETKDSGDVNYNAPVELVKEPTKDGYTFSGWQIVEEADETSDGATDATADNTEETKRGAPKTVKFNMPDHAVTVQGQFTANIDTEYTIETYLQNMDGTYPTTASSSTKGYGTTDTKATVTAGLLDGFTFDEGNQNNVLEGNIEGDGSLVLKLYYTRDDNPLYNFAHIKSAEGNAVKVDKWYIMNKTTIRTAQTLQEYIDKLPQNQNKRILNEEEYLADPYEFGPITVGGKTYQYYDGSETFNFDENYYVATPVTVKDGGFVTVWRNKIKGDSTEWLVPKYDLPTEREKLKSFHRDYSIVLHDGASEQPLYNMLLAGKVNGAEKWYRLKQTTIVARPSMSYGLRTMIFTEDNQEATTPRVYDFSTYTIDKNNITYSYKKDVDTSDPTVSWFETKFIRTYVIDNKVREYLKASDVYAAEPKDARSYHRDYEATFHDATKAHYTIRRVLIGTDIKVAEDVVLIDNVGATVGAPNDVTFLPGFEKAVYVQDSGKIKLVADATKGAENIITVYYRLPVTIYAEEKQGKVYGREEPTLMAKTDPLVQTTDEIKYTLSRVKGEDVGEYEINATYETIQGYYIVSYVPQDFVITQAPASELGLTAANYAADYDGEGHGITTALTVKEGTTLYYSTVNPQSEGFDEDKDWSTKVPTWTNVTTAQTVYVKAENKNYEAANANATVTIRTMAVKIEVENSSKIYSEKDPTFKKASIGKYIKKDLDTVDLTVSRTNTEEAVDTYNDVLTISKSAEDLNKQYTNYSFTIDAGDFTINPLKVEHYQEGLDSKYVLVETDNLTGKTDPAEKAEANKYTGFTFDEKLTKSRFEEDGSKVLEYYYTRNSYEVIYDYIDAPVGATKLPETVEYMFEEEVTVEPKAGNIEGYTVSEWDRTGTFKMPAEEVTIKATWTINQYTITFDTVGGSEVPAITQNYNTPVTAPADPTLTGYTFDGWDIAVPATMPAEDITITAKWKINQYTITFETAGGSAIDPITQDYNTAVTAPADPTREGYTFNGWDIAVPATMPAANMTITAQWKINQYTITFNTAGGSTIAPITQDYGTTVTTPDDPTREGYDFNGWNQTIPGTMPAENMTITATWTPKSYTVIYMVDGVEDSRETVTYLTHVTLKQAPTKNGFTFSGWMNEEGRAAADFDMPARDVTISGTFTENEKAATKYGLKVTYKTSNGDVVATFDEKYSEGEPAKAQRPIPDGYIATIRRISDSQLYAPVTENVDTVTKTTTIRGTIGNADVEYEVTYTPAQYTLTINFEVYGTGEEAATITRQYYGGAEYSILNSDGDIPWTELPRGYRIVEVKDKVMPNGDHPITVFLVPEGDDTVTFLDDPTPLGINNATLGAGEIIE